MLSCLHAQCHSPVDDVKRAFRCSYETKAVVFKHSSDILLRTLTPIRKERCLEAIDFYFFAVRNMYVLHGCTLHFNLFYSETFFHFNFILFIFQFLSHLFQHLQTMKGMRSIHISQWLSRYSLQKARNREERSYDVYVKISLWYGQLAKTHKNRGLRSCNESQQSCNSSSSTLHSGSTVQKCKVGT